jgi:hypothetical protein
MWEDKPRMDVTVLVPDSVLRTPSWYFWLWIAVGVWIFGVVLYLVINARRRPSNT